MCPSHDLLEEMCDHHMTECLVLAFGHLVESQYTFVEDRAVAPADLDQV